MKNKGKRIIALFLFVLFFLTLFTGCETGKSGKEYYTSVYQLEGKGVSAWMGSNIETSLSRTVSGVHIVPLDTIADMVVSLSDGKIEGFGQADFRAPIITNSISNITYLDDFAVDVDCAIAFANTEKAENLKLEFNEYLKSLEESGRLEELHNEWIHDLTPHLCDLELNSWDGSRGVVSVGASTFAEPFCYIYSEDPSGYEIALIYGFCKENHYEIKMDEPNFAGMLAGVASGQYDLGFGGIEITEERKKTVNFSDPIYRYTGLIYVIQDPDNLAFYSDTDELNGLDVGIIKGNMAETAVSESFPDSAPVYYNTLMESVQALKMGKIAYVVAEKDAASAMAVTEEYIQILDGSLDDQHLAVITLKETEESGFIEKVRKSIYKNLLLENRWKLILSGVGTTLGITLSSALIGSILGFALYMLCRKSRGFIPKVLDFFAWLIGGLPMVVMLMILYYVIFSKSNISSVSVSIIGFSVSLMLTVYSLLTTAVKSIGKDQLEGAYSVGLTDRQAFFKIILPQALVQFVPNYQAALVALIQGTAIVGYIAVEDITKVSDIIRARTYEAFFPLIITAILYLILGTVLTRIVRRIEINLDPRRRSDEKVLEKFKS